LPLKEEKITTINVLLLLLSHFFHLFFTLNSVVLLKGAQEYFLPQGARYPSYATVEAIGGLGRIPQQPPEERGYGGESPALGDFSIKNNAFLCIFRPN